VDYPLYITANGKLLRNPRPTEDAVGMLPHSNLDPHFLQQYLEYQKPKWHSPTGHTSLGLENALRALPLAIPTLYDQRKIVSILHEHDDVLHKLKTEQHELGHVIEGMMQQIFTGTLPLQEAITLFHTL
jgi:restriction endonuclease S subunit